MLPNLNCSVSVKVVLIFRETGSEYSCKWCYTSGIYNWWLPTYRYVIMHQIWRKKRMDPRSEHWADQAGEDSCWKRQPWEWYHSDKRRVFEKRHKKSPSSFCWRGNWKSHPVYGTDFRPYPHGRGTGKHKKNALVNREPAPSCTGRHIQGRSLASQKSRNNLSLIRKFAYNILRLAMYETGLTNIMTEMMDCFCDNATLREQYVFQGIASLYWLYIENTSEKSLVKR